MGATFVNITGQGYRAIVAQSESWTVVKGQNGTDVFPTSAIVLPADNDGDVKDAIVGGIAILFAFLIAAFFGFDTVQNGFAIIWDYVVTAGQGIAQIISAVFFHDVIPGPIAEDDTIHVIIFTIRDYLGLGNAYGIAPLLRSINPLAV